MNVLFVCTGNTCRSPMAEHLFRKMAREAGLNVGVASAGVSPTPGIGFPVEAQQALAAEGVTGVVHHAQGLNQGLVDSVDKIFVMEQRHKNVLLSRFPETAPKIEVFDVEDPYGLPVAAYIAALAKIKRQLEKVLERLK